jgi:hypothetical protein
VPKLSDKIRERNATAKLGPTFRGGVTLAAPVRVRRTDFGPIVVRR